MSRCRMVRRGGWVKNELVSLRRLLHSLSRSVLLRLAEGRGVSFTPGYVRKSTLVAALLRDPQVTLTDLILDGLKPEELRTLCDRVGIDPGQRGPGALAIRLRSVVAGWRTFEDARTYARGLGLTGASQWRRFCRGELPDLGELVDNVPARPHVVYAEDGWVDYADWLSAKLEEPGPRGSSRPGPDQQPAQE